jgi:putative phosphonate metabolism protein
MMSAPRYAIYFVPPGQSPLYRFGAAVLGRDGYSGEAVAFPPGFDAAAWRELSREPRRYGFHATLKAPFRLAAGQDEAGLAAAVADFARQRRAFGAGPLVVRELGTFLALAPETPCAPLDRLAADCVRAFEPFRAPLDDADRARRLALPLTPRQIEYLEAWGYPYVFEEFRFHMTLTGAQPGSVRKKALTTLRAHFALAVGGRDLVVGQIVVARQDTRGDAFKVITVAPFAGDVTVA